jgi:hypothetical protein
MSEFWWNWWVQFATAAATLSAVLTALFLAAVDGRRRREEKEREQAEQISGWMEFLPVEEQVKDGEIYVRLVVQNSSNQLVYELIASVVTAFGESQVGGDLSFRNFVGRLVPGRTEHEIKHPGQGMHKKFAIELAFSDAAGRTWRRRGRGRLERVYKKDPLALYGINPPVGWWMP